VAFKVGRRRWRRGLSDSWLALVLIVPAAILILALDFYPVLYAAFESFFRVDQLTGEQTWLGLDNYVAALKNPDVIGSVSNSIVYVVANTTLEIVLGTAIALLLNQPLRGRTLARGLVLFPFLIPAVVVSMTFQFIFNPIYGLFDYLLQLIIPHASPDMLGSTRTALWAVILVHSWKFIPFTVIVVLGRLQTIPPDVYEAAMVDGARRWQRFTHVTLPWLMPILLITMLLRTIWNATDYDLPYLLTGGGPLSASKVVPIEIRSLAFDQNNIGGASALAMALALVLIVISALYLRVYTRSAANIES
jgi:multiple sugar transport system permease protein